METRGAAAPVAGAVAAIATLACCLPWGIAGAVGVFGLGLAIETLRPWLMLLAVCSLAVGFYQLRRGYTACRRPSRWNIAILAISAAVVVAVLVFPQLVAEALAALAG